MKKILVTGATGFIGNYVIERLLERGHKVVATSSDAEKARKFSWFSRVQYIEYKLESFDDSADYFMVFKKPDILIHLAWEGLPNYKSAFHYEVNMPRHHRFLKNLIRNGLSDITVTGTCFEYGMKEGCLSEDLETNPANSYALAKDTLRKNLEKLQGDYKFNLKWVRLFYLYGRGQNPNSLLSQLERAISQGDRVFNMSGGEQVRDYMPVEEAALAIAGIALQDKVCGIINCCSGKPIKVRQLVEEYLKRTSKTISLNFGYYSYPDYEPMSFWGDNRKLKTIR